MTARFPKPGEYRSAALAPVSRLLEDLDAALRAHGLVLEAHTFGLHATGQGKIRLTLDLFERPAERKGTEPLR